MPSNDNTVKSILQPTRFLFYYLFSFQERLDILAAPRRVRGIFLYFLTQPTWAAALFIVKEVCVKSVDLGLPVAAYMRIHVMRYMAVPIFGIHVLEYIS